jgi:hypothetical protein
MQLESALNLPAAPVGAAPRLPMRQAVWGSTSQALRGLRRNWYDDKPFFRFNYPGTTIRCGLKSHGKHSGDSRSGAVARACLFAR